MNDNKFVKIAAKSNFVGTFIVGACMVSLSSCTLIDGVFGNSNDTPFNKKITAYLEKGLPVVRVSSEKYSAYVDFTGAMIACSDSLTSQTFNGLCQKITGNAENFDIYKLGDSKILPLSADAARPAQIFAQLKNAQNQQEFYAPIENALKKITDEGRSSVLITDFEEYTSEGQILRQAYATPYFKKWLASGGDITFYVTDYTEGSTSKHLYYVVFDYNEHALLKLVEQSLQGLPHNYQRFTLATNSYPMGTKYLAASKGGTYHDAAGDDVVSMSNENGGEDGYFAVEGLRAECYGFGASWTDIIGNANEQTRDNGCDGKNGASVPFTHLFRNLFIDLSHSDSYKLNSLDVRVTDVQDDFDKYWGYYIAVNNKPKIEKDENGNVYLNWTGHEAGEPYYDDNGNILPEYDYPKRAGKIVQIKDMLEFDNELFKQAYAMNPSEVELAIKFKKGFTGQILQGNPENLMRIDIIVKSASICDLNKLAALFSWSGNDCLFMSVKNALQEMNPEGRPIYSYFVRMQ